MEYRIHLGGTPAQAAAIEARLIEQDPSALCDFDAGLFRVSTLLGDTDLLTLMADAGMPLQAAQLERLPSVCCGGCSFG